MPEPVQESEDGRPSKRAVLCLQAWQREATPSSFFPDSIKEKQQGEGEVEAEEQRPVGDKGEQRLTVEQDAQAYEPDHKEAEEREEVPLDTDTPLHVTA